MGEKISGEIEAAKTAGEHAAAIEARIAAARTREEKLPLYEPLVKKLAADGNIAEAEAAIASMIGVINTSPREPAVSAFGTFGDALAVASARALHLEIAKSLAKVGDQAAARQQVAKARKAILLAPDESGFGKSMLIMALVDAQLKVGDLESARQLVEQLSDKHERKLAMQGLAHALIKAGDVAGAVQVARQITHETGRGRTVGRIAGELIQLGEIDEARALMDGLGDTAEDLEGYREVGEAMVASGHEAKLMEWLSEMPSAAARAYTCLGAAEKRVGPAQQLAPGK